MCGPDFAGQSVPFGFAIWRFATWRSAAGRRSHGGSGRSLPAARHDGSLLRGGKRPPADTKSAHVIDDQGPGGAPCIRRWGAAAQERVGGLRPTGRGPATSGRAVGGGTGHAVWLAGWPTVRLIAGYATRPARAPARLIAASSSTVAAGTSLAGISLAGTALTTAALATATSATLATTTLAAALAAATTLAAALAAAATLATALTAATATLATALAAATATLATTLAAA